jgi:hypothetical protein
LWGLSPTKEKEKGASETDDTGFGGDGGDAHGGRRWGPCCRQVLLVR